MNHNFNEIKKSPVAVKNWFQLGFLTFLYSTTSREFLSRFRVFFLSRSAWKQCSWEEIFKCALINTHTQIESSWEGCECESCAIFKTIFFAELMDLKDKPFFSVGLLLTSLQLEFHTNRSKRNEPWVRLQTFLSLAFLSHSCLLLRYTFASLPSKRQSSAPQPIRIYKKETINVYLAGIKINSTTHTGSFSNNFSQNLSKRDCLFIACPSKLLWRWLFDRRRPSRMINAHVVVMKWMHWENLSG